MDLFNICRDTETGLLRGEKKAWSCQTPKRGSTALCKIHTQLYARNYCDGMAGSSLGTCMLQGGVKKGLLLFNMQVE